MIFGGVDMTSGDATTPFQCEALHTSDSFQSVKWGKWGKWGWGGRLFCQTNFYFIFHKNIPTYPTIPTSHNKIYKNKYN